MTKISFDVDFSKDPELILKEIQERAKAEVEKRESKERNAAYLSKLHVTVNEKTGEPSPYVRVRDRLDALLSRSVYYQLAEKAIERDGQYGITSGNEFFPIGKVE